MVDLRDATDFPVFPNKAFDKLHDVTPHVKGFPSSRAERVNNRTLITARHYLLLRWMDHCLDLLVSGLVQPWDGEQWI